MSGDLVRVRRTMLVGLAVAMALSAAGCEGSGDHRDAAGRPQLTVAVTASSAEPRPVLSDDVRDELRGLGLGSRDVGAATVAVLVGGDGSRLPPAPRLSDLTPRRGAGVERVPDRRREKVAAAVASWASDLGEERSRSRGLDLLALLDRAGALGPRHIVVVSSGVSTVDPLDLRQLGWAQSTRSVVHDLARRVLLPRHLRGTSVTFVGLGETAGRQPRLMGPEHRWVEQLWLGVCRAAGASACRVGRGSATARPPVATLPVPVVRVPTYDTRKVLVVPAGDCRTVLRMSGRLLFRADSAELRPGSAGILGTVADRVQDGATIELLAGHTADVGSGHGLALSRQRARAVRRELIARGVPARRIRHTHGYGDRRPLESDIRPDGSVDERLAALNRRVEVTIRDTTCLTTREERP